MRVGSESSSDQFTLEAHNTFSQATKMSFLLRGPESFKVTALETLHFLLKQKEKLQAAPEVVVGKSRFLAARAGPGRIQIGPGRIQNDPNWVTSKHQKPANEKRKSHI